MRIGVRSMLRVVCGVLLGLGASGSASAATVTVVMTGQLTIVDDSNSVTDGSLSVGVPYTLTMVYDDSSPDLENDPLLAGLGNYLIPAADSSYTITVGSYTFDSGNPLNISLLDGFYAPSEDALIWYADGFASTGPLDPGVTFGTFGYSNPSLYDYSGTALTSDRLTDANWNRAAYAADNQAFYHFVEVLDPSTSVRDYVELIGSIDSISVVPEPAALPLVGSVLAALFGLRRRTR
jgi:hypothetical protein